MSFEDLKRDILSSKHFSEIDDIEIRDRRKNIVNSLVEKQFLSHLRIILRNNTESHRDMLVNIIERRYGLSTHRESTFLEITAAYLISLEQLSEYLVKIRYLCALYYSRHYRMYRVSVSNKLNHISFMCPGCNDNHSVRCNSSDGKSWIWNNDREKPTLTPSVLVRGTKLTELGEKQYELWVESGYSKTDKFDSVETICHSFVTEGKIEFLSDCTHNLRGQTVELPQWREEE